jgi:hypothetical protein
MKNTGNNKLVVKNIKPGAVAHTCKPSYLAGRICGLIFEKKK